MHFSHFENQEIMVLRYMCQLSKVAALTGEMLYNKSKPGCNLRELINIGMIITVCTRRKQSKI